MTKTTIYVKQLLYYNNNNTKNIYCLFFKQQSRTELGASKINFRVLNKAVCLQLEGCFSIWYKANNTV